MDTIIFIAIILTATLCAVKMSIWDWKSRIIPDVWLIPFLLLGLIAAVFFPFGPGIHDRIIAAICGYLLGTVMNLAFRRRSPDAIGMGDIKLLMAGGIWLGITGLSLAMIISCLAGVVWGIRKKQKFVPFAPFFFIGFGLSLCLTYFLKLF